MNNDDIRYIDGIEPVGDGDLSMIAKRSMIHMMADVEIFMFIRVNAHSKT